MGLIEKGRNLFVIDIEYSVPQEKVDTLIADHMTFVKKNYAEKRFIVSGPKVPRSGGMIIAVAESKDEVEALINEDPFYVHQVADFTITEFLPRTAMEGLI